MAEVEHDEVPESGDAGSPRRRRPFVMGAAVAPIAVVLVWLGFRAFGSTSPSGPAATGASVAGASSRGSSGEAGATASDRADSAAVEAADAAHRRTILGKWTRDYYGQWVMSIEEDGSGTLVVEPDRIWALVIGPKITVHIDWQVQNGAAVFDTLRGEPETSFNAAMKLWKKHQNRRIVELTDEKFVYLSDDGKSNSEWTRLRD